MKKNQVFLNTNGYKSIAYKINKDFIHILNYNGSIYRINKDYNYSYVYLDESLEGFVKDFPKDLLVDNHDNRHVRTVISNISTKFNNSNELLLLIN